MNCYLCETQISDAPQPENATVYCVECADVIFEEELMLDFPPMSVGNDHTEPFHDYGAVLSNVDFLSPVSDANAVQINNTIYKKGDTNMAKFRKKPVVINAVRITREMSIKTLEGTMVGNPGDWLITGVKNEQYFCKDDIFRQTYEAVDKDGEDMLLRVEDGH